MGNQNIQIMKDYHRDIFNDTNFPAVVNPNLQSCYKPYENRKQ